MIIVNIRQKYIPSLRFNQNSEASIFMDFVKVTFSRINVANNPINTVLVDIKLHINKHFILWINSTNKSVKIGIRTILTKPLTFSRM